jgi:uncharacterized protein with PIN domain
LEIDDAGELLFRTYFMVDWATVLQDDSDRRCITCGSQMKKVEPIRDKKGLVYDGLVCHSCKALFWLKRD